MNLYLCGLRVRSPVLNGPDAGAVGAAFAVIARVGVFRGLIVLIRCRHMSARILVSVAFDSLRLVMRAGAGIDRRRSHCKDRHQADKNLSETCHSLSIYDFRRWL